MKKNAFTLIEILTSFALFAILIFALMTAMKMMTTYHLPIEKEKEELRHLQFAMTTIESYLEKLDSDSAKPFEFKTNHGRAQLSFLSVGHIDRNPLFFNKRHITLTHHQNELLLIEQSVKENDLKRCIRLLSGVRECTFQFVYFDTNDDNEHIMTSLNQLEEKKVPFAIELYLVMDCGDKKQCTFLVPLDMVEPLTLIKEET